MRALDAYSGLGGWSDGLAMEGFEVLGVEIVPEIVKLYKHPAIIADFTTLDPRKFKGFDLIVGSPPCRDFSSLARMFGGKWKNPPDPEGHGLKLVTSFLTFVAVARPTYWIMENVPGLCNYLELQPRFKTKIGESMERCFWGKFPSFLVPKDISKKTFFKNSGNRMRRRPIRLIKGENGVPGWLRDQWERARIPMPLARALGKAVRESLEV